MPPQFDPAPFTGFTPATFDFLSDLKANNESAWFKPRKATYEQTVLRPLQALVSELAAALNASGLPLAGDPTRAIFRIYRDTRFTDDKSPYKTHAAAALTRNGKRDDPGVFYVHIEPEGCFLAAGFWQPEPELLAAWRHRMIADPESFLALVERFERAGLVFEDGGGMKRMPRGLEAHEGTAIAPYLRWRSFVVRQPVPEEAASEPGFVDAALRFAMIAQPLFEYGWSILARLGPPAGYREARF